MTLQEALGTNKKVARKGSDLWVQYFNPGTGPHKTLVGCSYFVTWDADLKELIFTTSIDLYPEEIFADDWEIVK